MGKVSFTTILTLFLTAITIGCGSSSPKGGGNPAYVTVRGTNRVLAYTLTGSGGLSAISQSPFVTGTSPSAVVVHPSKKFVYVANSADATVWVYSVDSNGALTQASQTAVGTNPSALAMDAGGGFLYVANAGSDSISAFSVDSTTGRLTAVAGSPASTSSPVALALAPSGKFLYVVNANSATVTGFSVNAGSLSQVSGPALVGTNPSSVTVDPGEHFVCVSSITASALWCFRLDPNSGVLNGLATAPIVVGTHPTALTFDSTGKFLYVANFGSNNISGFSIDATTGAATAISGSPFTAGTNPLFVVTDPDAAFLYAGNQGSNNISAFSIDTSSGALKSVSTIGIGTSPSAMVIGK
jgi:6-phosphogluconolactonase